MSLPLRRKNPPYLFFRGGALYETLRELAAQQGRPLARDTLATLAACAVVHLAGYDPERAMEGALAAILVLARRGYAEVAWIDGQRWEKGWAITDSGRELWMAVGADDAGTA